jgi:hypothetical protein
MVPPNERKKEKRRKEDMSPSLRLKNARMPTHLLTLTFTSTTWVPDVFGVEPQSVYVH